MKTDGFRQSFNRKRGERVDARVPGVVRAVRRLEQLLGSLEFRHQSVNWFLLLHCLTNEFLKIESMAAIIPPLFSPLPPASAFRKSKSAAGNE